MCSKKVIYHVPLACYSSFTVLHRADYTSRVIRELYTQQGTANGNDASPKGKAAGRMPILTIGTSARGVTSMAVSPDGMKVASTGKDGVLRIHELRTGVLLMGFKVQIYVYSPLTDDVEMAASPTRPCFAYIHNSVR